MRRHIAGHKAPRYIQFTAVIPRNVSGKILKNALVTLKTDDTQQVARKAPTMSSSFLVDVSLRDGTIVLRLQNPPVNAWSDDFVDDLEDALTYLPVAEARAVVVTGHGDHFSAGEDVRRVQELSDEESARKFVTRMHGIMDRVAALPVPVIAAVDGTASGAGLELALACDIRVASARAKLGLPETRWGILAGAGGTQRLARLIGPGRAKLLMYTAEPVTAQEALDLGLVEIVTDAPDPLPRALSLAEQIGRNSPRAVRHIKESVDQGLDRDLDEGLRIEQELWVELATHGDLTEGAAAFAEGREPDYR